MGVIGVLLILLGLLGLLLAVISIVYPLRALGIPTRKRALGVLLASIVGFVIGGNMLDEQEPEADRAIETASNTEVAPQEPATQTSAASVPEPDLSPDAGLGVSRDEIIAMLASIELDLEYEEAAPLASGKRRLMGKSDSPSLILELTGKPENLETVTLVFTPIKDNLLANTLSVGAVLAILATTMPDWEGSVKWFNDSLASGEEERMQVRDGKEVKLKNYAAITGLVVLSIKSLDDA